MEMERDGNRWSRNLEFVGDGVEWNGTVPHLEPVLVFGCEMEWNEVVPQKGIFPPDAERTGPAESAGRGGTALC